MKMILLKIQLLLIGLSTVYLFIYFFFISIETKDNLAKILVIIVISSLYLLFVSQKYTSLFDFQFRVQKKGISTIGRLISLCSLKIFYNYKCTFYNK